MKQESAKAVRRTQPRGARVVNAAAMAKPTETRKNARNAKTGAAVKAGGEKKRARAASSGGAGGKAAGKPVAGKAAAGRPSPGGPAARRPLPAGRGEVKSGGGAAAKGAASMVGAKSGRGAAAKGAAGKGAAAKDAVAGKIAASAKGAAGKLAALATGAAGKLAALAKSAVAGKSAATSEGAKGKASAKGGAAKGERAYPKVPTDDEFAMDLLRRIREICLALPEATEVEAWGHPTFRVNDKIFAGYGAENGRASLGVKTTSEMQAALVASDPRFSIAKYVGKHGWVDLSLEGTVDLGEVEVLVRGSYELIAPPKLLQRLRTRR